MNFLDVRLRDTRLYLHRIEIRQHQDSRRRLRRNDGLSFTGHNTQYLAVNRRDNARIAEVGLRRFHRHFSLCDLRLAHLNLLYLHRVLRSGLFKLAAHA